MHWAAGHGPVMNPGERVEGTSSLPWALVLALGVRAGIVPERAAPALSLLAVLAAVVLAHRFARQASGAVTATAAAWFTALAAPLAIWAASGMETVAYAVAAGAWFHMLARPGRGAGIAGGLLAGLVAMMRPEGVALALVPALVERPRRAGWMRPVLGAALAVAPWVAFRALYYGDLVPNPVHAKSPGPAALGPGLLYAAKAAASYALLFVFAAAGLQRVGRRTAGVAAAAILVQGVFTIAAGGDHFAGFRFLVPVLVPLAVLAAAGATGSVGPRRRVLVVACLVPGIVLTAGAERLVPAAGPLVALARVHLPAAAHVGRIADELRHLGIVCIGAALWFHFAAAAAARGRWWTLGLAAVAAFAPQAWDPQVRACRHADGASTYGRAVGAWLRGAVPAGTVVATNAAGALPYTSRLPVIDMLGLTDRTIARSRPDVRQWVGHERGDGAYVLGRRPGLIVLGGAEGALEPWPFPGDQQLFHAPQFHTAYVPMRARVPGPGGTFDFLFYCRADRRAMLLGAGAVDAARPSP